CARKGDGYYGGFAYW
nr:immunoglobulin heavy chain junction region [Mus musculus]NSM05475.1 immunoglobulin heavy chain junction region [Mus musculus]NSM05812.1 immunoglobulin heavy chain junction region [Mus musculus]NSM06032.1 immunoglobulin heavy chain junction region [Mus musculus]NSM06497.1 immunoglobulin heavy chain junction region [Mus musculus]